MELISKDMYSRDLNADILFEMNERFYAIYSYYQLLVILEAEIALASFLVSRFLWFSPSIEL